MHARISVLSGQSRRSFSLVEVVIALGVFAVAITSVLALLPTFLRQADESEESLTAQRLPDAVRVELQRLATAGGLAGLAANIPVMASPLQNGFAMVAARDGVRLHSASYLPPPSMVTIAEAEQFYAVECWRFNQPPLAYGSSPSLLAVLVRVSWPYHNAGGSDPTPFAARSEFTFTVAINP